MTAGLDSGWTMRRAALLGLLVSVAALALSVLGAAGSLRAGLVAGVVTAAFGGALGLVLVARSLEKPPKALIAALMMGFLARILLVGIGLVVTVRGLAGEPLGFVFSYFPLFFAFVVLELLVANAHVQRAKAARI